MASKRRDRALQRSGFQVVRLPAAFVLHNLGGALATVRERLGR